MSELVMDQGSAGAGPLLGLGVVIDGVGLPLLLAAGALAILATTLLWVARRRARPRGPGPRPSGRDQEAYRLLAEQTSDLVARLDQSGRFHYASQSWEQLGWAPRELARRSMFELVPEADHPELNALLDRLVAGGEAGPARYRLRSSRGEEIWVETVARAIRDRSTGEMIESQLAARDVTARVAAEDALRSSQARYRALVHGLREVVFETDERGNWRFLSPAWTDVTGYGVQESIGRPATDYLHPDDRDQVMLSLEAFRDGGQPMYSSTVRALRSDGAVRLLEVTARRQVDADGRTVGVVGTLDDRTETELARRERDRLAEILEATSDVVVTFDREGRIGWLNRAGLTALGHRADADLSGRNLGAFLPPGSAETFLAEVSEATTDDGVWSGEILLRRRDGTDVPFSQVVIPHRDEHGQAERFSAIARDISQRKQLERQLSHLALRDPLTGLANRTLLLDRLGQALARVDRNGTTVAVLFFDLDRFKLINDSFGHATGDQLLRELASRVEATIRPSDTAARFGGDEFVVICEGLDEGGALELADRIAEAMRRPVHAGGRDLELSTSIGIAIGRPGDDPAKVIGDADAAMYRAKERDPGSHRVYDETVRSDQQERLELEAGLARATERDELVLHYQPIVDLRTGRIHSMEALVRWDHPQRGLISPSDFVPIAEESGAIVTIGGWVLEEAARTIARWRDQHPGAQEMVVSVNLAGQQIMAGCLPDRLAKILERTGLPPQALILEITESMIVSDPRTTIATLERLRALGIRFALDDFGTGYAPLTHLRQLPVDAVKVDRSFVVGLEAGSADAAIIGALMELTEGLGLDLIAEGADSARHVDHLMRLRCRYVQGFHFAPPLPAAEAERLAIDGTEAMWARVDTARA